MVTDVFSFFPADRRLGRNQAFGHLLQACERRVHHPDGAGVLPEPAGKSPRHWQLRPQLHRPHEQLLPEPLPSGGF